MSRVVYDFSDHEMLSADAVDGSIEFLAESDRPTPQDIAEARARGPRRRIGKSPDDAGGVTPA